MKRIILAAAAALVLTPAQAAPAPPKSLAIVACRVDDLTGLPGRHDPAMAARGWRDLEWHLNASLEYECKRELLNGLQDSTQYDPEATGKEVVLHPNWFDFGQCARASMEIGPRWNDANRGWAVMAVGCPSPELDDNGTPDNYLDDRLVDWHMPGCPSSQPGTSTPENPEGNRMRCNFDASMI
jgi:hypothetical protein